MYYKLSNDFSVNDIESMQNLKFKFPDVFESRKLIDGLNEEILPVVLNNNQDAVDFAIWGLLPQNFKEDWSVFQNTGNTLNMTLSYALENDNYRDAMKHRRCCILTSGFFASYHLNGQVFPMYVYSGNNKVIALAGLYNITNDDFVTTTVLLRPSNNFMSNLHNLSNYMPVTLDLENIGQWLNDGWSTIAYNEVDDFDALNMKSHTIAKEFYKNNIVYETILEPVTYKNLSFNS